MAHLERPVANGERPKTKPGTWPGFAWLMVCGAAGKAASPHPEGDQSWRRRELANITRPVISAPAAAAISTDFIGWSDT